jgi:hypothetical protein
LQYREFSPLSYSSALSVVTKIPSFIFFPIYFYGYVFVVSFYRE